MSWLHLSPDITGPRFRRAWKSEDGESFAVVELAPDVKMTFASAEDARAVAAACTEAAEALERPAAEPSGHPDPEAERLARTERED